MTEEEIKIIKNEFDEASVNAKYFRDIQEKRIGIFWQTKKAFVALVGVIFTIVISQKDIFELSFGINFITLFLFFVICGLLLIIDEHWQNLKDVSEATEKQNIKTICCNIRYIAAIEKDENSKKKFYDYACEAENMIRQNHAITKDMIEDKPLKKILDDKMQEGKKWKMNFLLWFVIFFSIPVLFLMKILDFLK